MALHFNDAAGIVLCLLPAKRLLDRGVNRRIMRERFRPAQPGRDSYRFLGCDYHISLSSAMAEYGHSLSHMRQPVHDGYSINGASFATVMVFSGQTATHIMHFVHFFMSMTGLNMRLIL